MTKKISISAPEELFDEAEARARVKKMGNFSEYIRDLIRQDLAGSKTNKEEESSTHESH